MVGLCLILPILLLEKYTLFGGLKNIGGQNKFLRQMNDLVAHGPLEAYIDPV